MLLPLDLLPFYPYPKDVPAVPGVSAGDRPRARHHGSLRGYGEEAESFWLSGGDTMW